MKAKLKTIKISIVFMAIILSAYFVHLNLSISEYKKGNENISTANYLSVDDIREEVSKNIEKIKEEVSKDLTSKLEEEEGPIVYDGKTLKEVSETIEKSLNSTISGKGYLIASYSIEKGVDPYLATAIILHETGCKWNCSYLVRECNNVGGQKGKGCGNYSYFPTLDEGIKAFVDNLERNYISRGLTTPETINKKYASDPNWATKVNKYIENIMAQ